MKRPSRALGVSHFRPRSFAAATTLALCLQAASSNAQPAAKPAATPAAATAPVATPATAPAKVAASGAQAAVSTARDRKQVSITVYNQNFGLVREQRELSALPNGRVTLEFQDVAATIQPETVHIHAANADALRVLEQNYRYDLISPQTLLEKYVGKRLKVYRYHTNDGKEDAVDADLLAVANGPVLSINGEVTFDYGGRFALPALPPNLIARPTLSWLLENKAPRQNLEVTYLAQEMNWSADYVLLLNPQETKADLTGWVTLVNQSGAAYENAELKLVAGTVNRVQPVAPPMPRYAKAEMASAGAPAFREEGLLEYHLYTLSRPTTLLHNEKKQVTLLEAQGIGVTKKLIFNGQDYWYRGNYGEVVSNQKVGVYLDIQNTEKNRLGMPLPKGTLRVYKSDKAGSRQFVGEDAIDHTPRDEKVRVKLGEAFDVVADRKQLKYSELGSCSSESSWRVELKNHKDVAVEIEDNEPVSGDWTIVSSSHPATRQDARRFSFTVQVPARGKVTLEYVVRVRWC